MLVADRGMTTISQPVRLIFSSYKQLNPRYCIKTFSYSGNKAHILTATLRLFPSVPTATLDLCQRSNEGPHSQRSLGSMKRSFHLFVLFDPLLQSSNQYRQTCGKTKQRAYYPCYSVSSKLSVHILVECMRTYNLIRILLGKPFLSFKEGWLHLCNFISEIGTRGQKSHSHPGDFEHLIFADIFFTSSIKKTVQRQNLGYCASWAVRSPHPG